MLWSILVISDIPVMTIFWIWCLYSLRETRTLLDLSQFTRKNSIPGKDYSQSVDEEKMVGSQLIEAPPTAIDCLL